jgi:hypothetical protein
MFRAFESPRNGNGVRNRFGNENDVRNRFGNENDVRNRFGNENDVRNRFGNENDVRNRETRSETPFPKAATHRSSRARRSPARSAGAIAC